MKNIVSQFFIVFLLVNTIIAQPKQSSKDFKDLIKEYRKQGYKPDPTFGSTKHQIKIIDYYSNLIAVDFGESAYWLESIEAESSSKELASDKARDLVRAQFGKNNGNIIKGMLEHSQTYYSSTGRHSQEEIRKIEGTFNDIFNTELSRNKIIARFYKETKTSNINKWYVFVVCVINVKELEENMRIAFEKKKEENRIILEQNLKNEQERIIVEKEEREREEKALLQQEKTDSLNKICNNALSDFYNRYFDILENENQMISLKSNDTIEIKKTNHLINYNFKKVIEIFQKNIGCDSVRYKTKNMVIKRIDLFEMNNYDGRYENIISSLTKVMNSIEELIPDSFPGNCLLKELINNKSSSVVSQNEEADKTTGNEILSFDYTEMLKPYEGKKFQIGEQGNETDKIKIKDVLFSKGYLNAERLTPLLNIENGAMQFFNIKPLNTVFGILKVNPDNYYFIHGSHLNKVLSLSEQYWVPVDNSTIDEIEGCKFLKLPMKYGTEEKYLINFYFEPSQEIKRKVKDKFGDVIY